MSKNVVVTGASGHIGFHVAYNLLELGYHVTLLIRNNNKNTAELIAKGAVAYHVDLFDASTYRHYLTDCDCLFHLAAENTTATDNEDRIVNSCLQLTQQVVTAAFASGIKTVVYTSSVVVLGRSSSPNKLLDENDRNTFPESPYVKGKILADQFCEKLIQEGKDIRRMYPSWVIGGNIVKLTPPLRTIRDAMLKEQPFYFTGGISIADVYEVARGHINAWRWGEPAEQYVLGGENVTFLEFYSSIAALTLRKKPIFKIPQFVLYYGAIIAKYILGNSSPIDPKYVKSVIGKYSWYNSSKAINTIGYKIPPMQETLKRGIEEIKHHITGLALPSKSTSAPPSSKITYAADDILLVIGFPGWLTNRMVDIFMNGDYQGNYAVQRNIRLLVLNSYKNLKIALPDNFEIVYGDLQDKESLKSALAHVKTVYHCAGVIYPPKIKTLYEVNWEGTKNLVDVCIETGVRRIISMGTDSICGYSRKNKFFDETTKPNPYKHYGKSKYLAEKYILDKTREGLIDGTSLRGFWFFGPYMPLRNQRLIHTFKWPRHLVFGNGKNYRSISHVDNIVQAFIKSEQETATYGKWYWISDAKWDLTVDDIFSEMASAVGKEYKPFYIPNVCCSMLNMADSILNSFGFLNATIHSAAKFNLDIAGESSSAKRDFGYTPINTFDYFKKEVDCIV